MSDNAKSKRYPVEMHKYIQRTGRLLVHRIAQILKAEGYTTWINPKQNNGIDLVVWKNGKLILVAEVFNWSSYTYFSVKRKSRITKNLQKCNKCTKLLIYTAMRNETVAADLWTQGIQTLKIGYQILPEYFHRHYEAKNQIIDRMIDSTKTTHHLRAKIAEFMQLQEIEIGILPTQTQDIQE